MDISRTTDVDFRMLGPLEVVRNGHPVAIGGPKQRVVLAALLVERGRSASVPFLTSAVWDGRPPADFHGSLQVSISALRRVLRSLSLESALTTVPGGYRLEIDDHLLDVARFQRDSSLAATHFAAHRFAEAGAACTRALSHWRGRALQDLGDFRYAVDVAAALDEELLAVRALRIDSDLACGQHATLLAELSELTAAHPLHEKFWGQLVIALYRADRQADALAALRRVREMLAAELGVDPGPALRDLEGRILRHDMHDTPTPERQGLAATVMESDPASGPRGHLVGRAGERVAVPSSGLTIGRAPDNGLVLADVKVSRQHAAITTVGSDLVVSDLRSTNGVWVNEVRLEAVRVLQPADVIRFGATEFTVELLG